MAGMFGAIMTVCLAATAHCKDVVLATQDHPIPPNQCMQQAMPEMTKWIGDHQGWEIKNWSCGHVNQLKVSL